MAQPPVVARGGEAFQTTVRAVFSAMDQSRNVVTWDIHCQILPTIRLKASVLSFGIQSDCNPNFEQAVDIEASDMVSSVTCDAPPDWNVAVTAAAGNAGFRAVIRSVRRLSPRDIEDVIRFTPVSREGRQLPAKDLKLRGRIVHDVIAVPAEIHFGQREFGTTGTESLCLRSLTGRKFRVESAIAASDNLIVKPSATDSDRRVYAASLNFAKSGGQETTVTFRIREEDENRVYEVMVPIRYKGVDKR